MNQEVATSLLYHIDDDALSLGHAPEATRDWLKILGLPVDLLQFMMFNWAQADGHIGAVDILCSKAIPEQEDVDVYVTHKLLPVGSGPNGDRFVIDYSTDSCPVGFVTSSEYGGEGDPREFFRTAARSVESFLHRIAEGRFYPCEYYETGAFNEFLRAEAGHDAFPPYAPRQSP